MTRLRSMNLPASIIPLLLQGGALLVFILKRDAFEFDPRFFLHAFILFGVVFACGILFFFLKREGHRWFCLFLQTIAALVIGYPLGKDVFCETLLGAAAAFSFTLNFPALLGWGSGCFFLLLLAYLQQGVIVWERLILGPDEASVTFLLIVGSLALLLGHIVREKLLDLADRRERINRLNATILDLTRANVGFQQYADSVVEQSLADERRRISRELHDTVGYSLTNIRMLMEEAIGMYDGPSEDFVQVLVSARDQAKTAMEDIRSALKTLRAIFEAKEDFDLRALRKIAAVFNEATHVEVRLDTSNTKASYGKAVDHCVYRLVQEGMTNSIRHGKASLIQIYLFENEETLFVVISDNGTSCDEIVPGIGISGMVERVGQVGGTVRFENGKSGFSINARIPFAGKAA